MTLRLSFVLVLVGSLGCSSDSSNSPAGDTEPDSATPDVDAEADGDGDGDVADGDDGGPPADPDADRAVAALTATALKAHIDFLADDALGGRVPGSPGHIMARDYLVDQMESVGLEPFGDDDTYLHDYPSSGRASRFMLDEEGEIVPNTNDTGYNVVGLLPGSDTQQADEYIVLLAHYDHLGVTEGGDVFNGAHDDASGVAVLLEVARVLAAEDAEPRRSIIFLITDDEENGLFGAENWIADPPIDRGQIVMGLSADPVGRRLLPDYGPLVLAGMEQSPELLAFWRQTAAFTDADVVFVHRRMIPGFASDQDELFAQSVPAGWYVAPGMTFYHTVNDTAETIDYRMVLEAARYLTRCVRLVGNSDERFEFVGEPELSVEHAVDVKVLLEGILTSSFPNDNERQSIEDHIATADQVIEDGSWDNIDNPDAYFLQALGLAAFILPGNYPGEVPPPFPDE